MIEPAQLAYPANLPDDLKVLLHEHKIPKNDPLIVLLAWHWLRINESRDEIKDNTVQLRKTLDEDREAIQENRLKIEAALDVRLEQMEEWTDTFKGLYGHLEKLSQVLAEKPLGISQQIQEDLNKPIAESVKSTQELATTVSGLVATVDESLKRLRRSHVITAFLSGYSTGVFIVSWIYFHFFLH